MSNLFKENRLKQNDVDNACVAITQRGERISTNTVHKEVGERGSFSTIQKMIKEWQARNPIEFEQVENLPLKTDIPESLKAVSDNALKNVWYQARELAHNELEIQRESLRKAEDDVNLKIVELQEFSDNQANTIDALREQLAQANATISKFEKRIKTNEETIKSLDKQVTTLQTALDVQDKQITEVKTERTAALSAEKTAIEQAANLTGQLTQVLKELKGFQDKAKEVIQ